MPIEAVIDKGSNIQVYKTLGDNVMEGDTLFTYQADFDEDVANGVGLEQRWNMNLQVEERFCPVETR